MSRTTSPSLSRRVALASLLVLPLAACSAGADGEDQAGGSSEAGNASDGGASDGGGAGDLTVSDPWVKASESGMTAAFGTLANGTERELVLVAATSPASAMVELHETTLDGSGGMSMKEKEGGFTIPAGGELVLEPGGNHIMLMDLAAPLLAGDEIDLVLTFEDDTELPFTATVKDFTGAQENYAPDGSSGASDGGGEHDMGAHASDGGEE